MVVKQDSTVLFYWSLLLHGSMCCGFDVGCLCFGSVATPKGSPGMVDKLVFHFKINGGAQKVATSATFCRRSRSG
jgi:Fe-S oxidoreductase